MIVLSPDAVLDVERLRSFLDEKSPGSSENALHLIWSALERIQDFPDSGLRTDNPFIRQVVVRFGRAGYVVRYSVLPDGNALVTRIWHSREKRV